MKRVKIYRVKAIDSAFESVWFFDKKACKQIIKNIKNNPASQLACGSQHIIEENELGM